jgi:antitoxin component YwqK of YwqJK toxin-antitoxin module
MSAKIRIRTMGVTLFLAAVVAGGVRAVESGDVGFVGKADVLPSAAVRSEGDIARIKPLLASLPEGHRLRLEFNTAPRSTTGYKEDIRYVRLATAVAADGKPDGQEVEFSDHYRRAVRATEYRNGIRQGVERQYDVDTGVLLGETPWEKGAIHGVKRLFHPNGKPASETTYEKGVIVGPGRSFDAGGRLIRVVNHANGKRDGETIDYWADKPEVVQRTIPYKNDLVEGVAKGFYLNGRIKWERPFRNNRQHGVEKQYAADGAVEKTLYWLDGTPVSAEEYRAKGK